MPRFSSALNRFLRGESVTPVASAARTANGDSGWLSSELFDTASFLLDVTAASGTAPSLDVILETASTVAGANTRTVASFAQKTAVSSERKTFSGFDQYYRARWTVGGTSPNFTFSVAGETK